MSQGGAPSSRGPPPSSHRSGLLAGFRCVICRAEHILVVLQGCAPLAAVVRLFACRQWDLTHVPHVLAWPDDNRKKTKKTGRVVCIGGAPLCVCLCVCVRVCAPPVYGSTHRAVWHVHGSTHFALWHVHGSTPCGGPCGERCGPVTLAAGSGPRGQALQQQGGCAGTDGLHAAALLAVQGTPVCAARCVHIAGCVHSGCTGCCTLAGLRVVHNVHAEASGCWWLQLLQGTTYGGCVRLWLCGVTAHQTLQQQGQAWQGSRAAACTPVLL
jgi:hypothetical protein